MAAKIFFVTLRNDNNKAPVSAASDAHGASPYNN